MTVNKRVPGALQRGDSSQFQFVKRVPADVLELARDRTLMVDLPAMRGSPETTVTATIRSVIKTSLFTSDPVVADARHALVKARVLGFFDAVRTGPVSLSQRNCLALARDIYDHLIELHGDNPGSPDNWSAVKGFNRAVREGRVQVAPSLRPNDRCANEIEIARTLFGVNLTAGIDEHPSGDPTLAALEARFSLVATWILQRRGLEIDAASRRTLLEMVEHASTLAAMALKRMAGKDYTPDTAAASFPTFRPSVTLDDLFARWSKANQPSPSTVMTWSGYVKGLVAFMGHDRVADITKDLLERWRDASLERGLTPRTVRDGHLTAIKAVLGYAVETKVIPTNPATGIKVRVKVKAGEGMLSYSDDEVARLLALASKEVAPARRWLPWLAALSGARIAELAQLWGSRVEVVDGVAVMHLRPAEDGGSLKNHQSERTVPIHPALLDQGFLQFVQQKGDGPLFYGRSSGKAGVRHASKGVSNHLATWIRDQGFNDRRIAPNHGLRAWFKTKADEIGISSRMADHLQGHSPASTAAGYVRPSLKAKAEAVARIPVPEIASQQLQAAE